MVRHPRIIVPGIPHHIVHKGNHGKTLFHSQEDYLLYLTLLKFYSSKHGMRLLSYCLMPNHIHIVGIPEHMNSAPLMIRDAHQRYSLYLNKKMATSGHNWQNRYFMCACDESHGIASMCYTELNPVIAGIVNQAWDYEWSSAKTHCGSLANSDFLDLDWWRDKYTLSDWIEMLNSCNDNDLFAKIKDSTHTGVPLGTSEFLKKIESSQGINLLQRKINHAIDFVPFANVD